MPQIKYYTVTQIQEVKVAANNELDAVRLGAAAFEEGVDANGCLVKKPFDIDFGDTRSEVTVTALEVRSD